MKKFLLLYLISSTLVAETVTLSVTSWPPFIGKGLKNNGVAAEIVRQALRHKGHKLKLNFEDCSSKIKSGRAGKTDGIFPEYFDEAKTKDFTFSLPFFVSPLVLAVRNHSRVKYTGKKEELEILKLGIVKGYINTKEIDANNKIIKVVVPNDLANLLKLTGNLVDAVVINEIVAKDIATNVAKQLKGKIKFLRPVLEDKKFYIAWSNKGKNQERFTSDFNAGFAELQKSGKLNKILKEYGL